MFLLHTPTNPVLLPMILTVYQLLLRIATALYNIVFLSNVSPRFLLCNVREILSGNVREIFLDNSPQGFYLFNVGSWLTDNFCEKNNLCNVVLTMLGQHCVRILSSQCFLNVSLNGNIMQKKYCAILAMGAQTMVLQENKPQRCLDLPEPTLPKKITFAMLAQSTQIYFCRKTRFLNMLGGLFFKQIHYHRTILALFVQRWRGLGVHLWPAGQQWMWADIDWNTTICLPWLPACLFLIFVVAIILTT